MTKPVLILVGLLAAQAAGQTQTTYDPASEFSPTHNPAGVWSYGYGASFGAFTVFPLHGGSADTLYAWYRDPAFPACFPTVQKNDSGGIYAVSGNVFQIGQLALHPGNTAEDQYAVVRFRAATTGVYTVSARFSGLCANEQGTTTDVHVLVNGASFFDGRVQGYASEASFTSPFALTLREGDVIDFVVGNGGNEFWNDETGLAATVTLVQPGVAVRLYPAVEIGWNTEAGKTYQVQSSTTLLTNDWTNIGAPVAGDGAIRYTFDSVRGQPDKFYRVVTVP